MDGDNKKNYWCSGDDLCFPVKEGGNSFKISKDIFNTSLQNSGRSSELKRLNSKYFLEAKYCKRYMLLKNGHTGNHTIGRGLWIAKRW